MPTKKEKDHKILIKINNKISTGETKSKRRRRKRGTKSYYINHKNAPYNPNATAFYTGGGGIPMVSNKSEYITTPIQPITNPNEVPKQEREKKLITGNPLIDGMNKQGLNQLLIAGGEQPKPRAKRSDLIKQVDNRMRKQRNTNIQQPAFYSQEPVADAQYFQEPHVEEAVSNPHLHNFQPADDALRIEELVVEDDRGGDDNNTVVSDVTGEGGDSGGESESTARASQFDSVDDGTVIIRDTKNKIIQTPSNKKVTPNKKATPVGHDKKYGLRQNPQQNTDSQFVYGDDGGHSVASSQQPINNVAKPKQRGRPKKGSAGTKTYVTSTILQEQNTKMKEKAKPHTTAKSNNKKIAPATELQTTFSTFSNHNKFNNDNDADDEGY